MPSAEVTGPHQPGQRAQEAYTAGSEPGLPTDHGVGRAGHPTPRTEFLIGNLTDDRWGPCRTSGKCTGHSDC